MIIAQSTSISMLVTMILFLSPSVASTVLNPRIVEDIMFTDM